jgi:hypothetical protein
MEGSVLEVTYHLNPTKTKSVTIGHEATSAELEPYVWLYKSGQLRIKFTLAEWQALLMLKTTIASLFETEESQPVTYNIGSDISLHVFWKQNTQLIYIERSPTLPASRITKAAHIWLCYRTWNNIFSKCIENSFTTAVEQVAELKTLFESLGHLINHSYGKTLRENLGDVNLLRKFLLDYNTESLQYISQKNMDVKRALNDMKEFCTVILCEYLKHDVNVH